jgi:hypothetical protein
MSAPHSSVFAHLASGAFYETSGWMTFCEVTKFIDHYKWRSVFFKLNLDGFVRRARGQAWRLRNLHKLFLVDEIIPEALEYDSAKLGREDNRPSHRHEEKGFAGHFQEREGHLDNVRPLSGEWQADSRHCCNSGFSGQYILTIAGPGGSLQRWASRPAPPGSQTKRKEEVKAWEIALRERRSVSYHSSTWANRSRTQATRSSNSSGSNLDRNSRSISVPRIRLSNFMSSS